MGHWSSFAELWFQKRLDKIRSHEAPPKTVVAWKNDVKIAPIAKRLRLAVDMASERFMESRTAVFCEQN